MRLPTQADRSNIMKMSAFSCGVSDAEQPLGKGQPCVGPKLQVLLLHTPPRFVQHVALQVLFEQVPAFAGQVPVPARDVEPAETCRSENTIRPHWLLREAVSGVSAAAY